MNSPLLNSADHGVILISGNIDDIMTVFEKK